MPININTYCRINKNGSININTDPTFLLPPLFNFEFNQQWASPNATVTDIGGFTSNPAFTPTSNAFIFNSFGTPLGLTTFSFTMNSNNFNTTIIAELIKNSVSLQTIGESITFGYTFIFTPISVLENDTIEILTYVE
jgi:hypothetical protein